MFLLHSRRSLVRYIRWNLYMRRKRFSKVYELIMAPAHFRVRAWHYNDVIMSTMASPITSLTIVYSIGYSGAYQRKHQSSASLAFVRGIHRGPVNSPHKWPVTGKMFPFDDVIMVGEVGTTFCKVVHQGKTGSATISVFAKIGLQKFMGIHDMCLVLFC